MALMICCIAGCSSVIHRKKRNLFPDEQESNSIAPEEAECMHYVKELEAKLMDVPFFLDMRPILNYCCQDVHDDSCSLGYRLNSCAEDITQFYLQEMDRFGWKKTVSIRGVEHLMVFEKPDRFCVISLRPDPDLYKQNSMLLVIFTGKR